MATEESASPSQFKALGESADKNRELYKYDRPDAAVLETFPNPINAVLGAEWLDGEILELPIKVVCTEFTSLCPLTGQPDFGQILVDYIPSKLCLESKSFKLYLMGYRQHGAFAETVAAMILEDLVKLLKPASCQVTAKFTARGAISFEPTAHYFAT